MKSIFRKLFVVSLIGALVAFNISKAHAKATLNQSLWLGSFPLPQALDSMFGTGFVLGQEEPSITPRKDPNPFARRTEVVFFIALGFSIFYSRLLNSLYANANAITLNAVGYGDIEGEAILMSALGEPIEDYRPINLFLWVNSLTWPFAITFNSVVENFNKQDVLFPKRVTADKTSRTQYRVRMHYYQSSF